MSCFLDSAPTIMWMLLSAFLAYLVTRVSISFPSEQEMLARLVQIQRERLLKIVAETNVKKEIEKRANQ